MRHETNSNKVHSKYFYCWIWLCVQFQIQHRKLSTTKCHSIHALYLWSPVCPEKTYPLLRKSRDLVRVCSADEKVYDLGVSSLNNYDKLSFNLF